ncbi:MAG: FAD-dependent oxidoreductase, partial [Pseudomonadota bacterium]
RAMQALGEHRGARYRFGAGVEEILVRGGRVCGVRLSGGEEIPSDAVVFNGDSAALAGGLLGEDVSGAVPTTPRSSRSLSAVTWCVAAAPKGFPLQHHNVFFSNDYPREFRSVFEDRRTSPAPTVYLCAQGRSAKRDAPAPGGPEPMLILINAPADGDRGWPAGSSQSSEELQARMLEVTEACGLTLAPEEIEAGQCTTPTEFAECFPGNGGALYGRANHGPFAIFERASTKLAIEGLYQAGGSAHPGAGVPMATLSGRLAAARLLQDRVGLGATASGASITVAKTVAPSPMPGA